MSALLFYIFWDSRITCSFIQEFLLSGEFFPSFKLLKLCPLLVVLQLQPFGDILDEPSKL